MAETGRVSARIPEPTRQMAFDKCEKQGTTISHIIRLLVDGWVYEDQEGYIVRQSNQ